MIYNLIFLIWLIGQTGGLPNKVVIVPYQNRQFVYYTIWSNSPQINEGWSLTGFQTIASVGADTAITWVTAAHYFPFSMEPKVIPMEINHQILYINKITYLGGDLCLFKLGSDSVFVVKGFSERAAKEIHEAGMEILLFDRPPDTAFYLVDRQYYPVIGSIVIHEPQSDVSGFLIQKRSEWGDCGTAFLYDDQLCVITKSLPAGLQTANGEELGDLTIASPLP